MDRDTDGVINGTDKKGRMTQVKCFYGSQRTSWRDAGWNPKDDGNEIELIRFNDENYMMPKLKPPFLLSADCNALYDKNLFLTQ